jgi:cytochrome oxidase Cu insertion factor (SCO1/SenC/PrrC family)
VIDAGAEVRPWRRSHVLIAAVVALAGLAGIGIGVGLHFVLADKTASAPVASRFQGEATWAAGAKPAPPITTLRDQSGRLFSLASLRGRTVIVSFFDSHCTQACPLEGRALAASERALPRAERPALVVVSVNPSDTPASTRAAMHKWGLAGLTTWHWLRGGKTQLAPVWHAYHVFVAPERGDIVHTEALYLLDRRLDERSAYLYPFAPRYVTSDLTKLARA